MKPEILAPAGSRESLMAAVRCGANAVYFGGKAFNARRNATNFTDEEIKEAVEYCHSHGVKVYITLNTLATDREINDALNEIVLWADMGVDAFIIQDLGLASLVRQVCPSISMHGSTQMSVQSMYGFKTLENMGFVRAVVPRELTKEEIETIHNNSDLEIEAFVHGALCMCVSGQCLMSSVIGGRSGNRGLCAQPCRLPFGVNGKGGNNLSLKDLSLIDNIPALVNAGAVSLKIEGRMKRPEYVAAAVTACKNKLENKKDDIIANALGAVFSRSGFTSGYFENNLGKEMFGIRTKEDVQSATSVLNDLSHLYDNENPLIPVKMHFEMRANQRPKIWVEAMNYKAECEGKAIPQKAINKAITFEDARERLSKCGGTQFYISEFTAKIDEGLNMPASQINSMRRDALCMLEKEIAKRQKPIISDYKFEKITYKSKGKQLNLRFFKEEQIPDILDAQRVIIPLETGENTVKKLIDMGLEVLPEIPINVFSNGEKYMKHLSKLKNLGIKTAWACNLDGVQLAKEAGLDFAAGFGMNVLNTLSINEIERLGAKDCLLSAEISNAALDELGGNIPRGILSYGRLPLMVTRNCPVKNKISCAQCRGNSYIEDRKGVKFPVTCKNGCSFVLNSVPLCVYDREKDFTNIDFELLYFTTETKDEVELIIQSYKNKENPQYEYTRGLYFRNVL